MQLMFLNLFANCPLVKVWGLPPLSITVDIEVKKPVECNWPLLFVKTSAFLLDSQDNYYMTKAKGG